MSEITMAEAGRRGGAVTAQRFEAGRLTPSRKSRNRGQRNGRAKLTWDQVRQLRAERAAGVTVAALLQRYPVTETPLRQILSGKAWQEAAP